MNRSTKLLLGAATIWPVVYMFLFMAFILGMLGMSDGSGLGPLFGAWFAAIFVVHFLTIILSLGLTVYYIIHAVKNEALESNMKAIWAVLFFVGGMIAEPIYFYMHIWKAPEDGAPPGLLGGANTSTWDFESSRAGEGEYQPPPDPPDWR